ncbi:MAG: NUDIX domain-containing protein [Prolixibacteraceae bacterium]|nr:NUDIX domain-containing protein [Prolixibacteraceae bacterium]
MEIRIYRNKRNNRELTYVLMLSRHEEKYVFVRHKLRETWELPAGRIEKGETPYEAACRELYEETGAVKYHLQYLFDYSVTIEGETGYGRFYQATILKIGPLPNSEIAEIKLTKNIPEHLTYKRVQPRLIKEALNPDYSRIIPISPDGYRDD